MMSLLAVPFGLRFCVSRRVGQGGMHPKGANSMDISGLVSRNNLVGTGRAISVLFGVRNGQSHLVGPPFPAFNASVLRRKVETLKS